MTTTETGLFTVAVFQDASWAAKGLEALKHAGFPPEALSIVARDDAAASTLIQQVFGAAGERLEIASLGPIVGKGRLLEALQGGAHDLPKLGVAATMRRVGFQPHDGRIYETLLGRGGVLVAIRSEPRAADALAIMHSYGGGNAAIGAWGGRL